METGNPTSPSWNDPSGIFPDINTIHMEDCYGDSEETFLARKPAITGPVSRLEGSRNNDQFSLLNIHTQNELNGDLTEKGNNEPCDRSARSRRGQYLQHQDRPKEGCSSLDRSKNSSERRPSLERLHYPLTERRPSLEQLYQYQRDCSSSSQHDFGNQSERRPSLEQVYSSKLERRPSLEQIEKYNSEKRASKEHITSNNLERRPSLDRVKQRRIPASERRPSLERLQQYGLDRRSSLDRLKPEDHMRDSFGSAQGVNTLHPSPLNAQGVPQNWDLNHLPIGDSLYSLVMLSPMDREYAAITVDFEEAGLKVNSVERLQNLMLLEKFNQEKEYLQKRRPKGFNLNERYLYHGTPANKNRLCEEGLDHRLSFQGCFGRGIYFRLVIGALLCSDNPRKCMQYATSTSTTASSDSTNTCPMILVCRVLLGDPKIYDNGVKDADLKREPEKINSKGGWRYYDSVQGVPVDYPEFVVYDNRRSMIEYIITFEEVSYRGPPRQSSLGQSLYKVEPIVLPISEEELDRLYMLGPDTDSDGSCDEHTREVERLRDNVKRGKAKRLGIPYRPPTEEEKRYERLHWKRVCYYSCPPNSPLYEMMILKKKEEKTERMKRKKLAREKKSDQGGAECALGAEKGLVDHHAVHQKLAFSASHSLHDESDQDQDQEDFSVENESVAEVLTTLIADFLTITATDDVKAARNYIMDNSMDLDQALSQYFREMP